MRKIIFYGAAFAALWGIFVVQSGSSIWSSGGCSFGPGCYPYCQPGYFSSPDFNPKALFGGISTSQLSTVERSEICQQINVYPRLPLFCNKLQKTSLRAWKVLSRRTHRRKSLEWQGQHFTWSESFVSHGVILLYDPYYPGRVVRFLPDRRESGGAQFPLSLWHAEQIVVVYLQRSPHGDLQLKRRDERFFTHDNRANIGAYFVQFKDAPCFRLPSGVALRKGYTYELYKKSDSIHASYSRVFLNPTLTAKPVLKKPALRLQFVTHPGSF